MRIQPADCHVWWIDPAQAPDWCEELLSEPERIRAGSFHQGAARRRFVSATALLKITVAWSDGGDPLDVDLRRECPRCGKPHGRPEVAGSPLHVSISHSGDRVAVALCAAGPVGVDVEQVNPDVDVDVMLPFVLGDAEARAFGEIRDQRDRLEAFLRSWTRKESVLKATGDGLLIPMSHLTVGSRQEPTRLVRFVDRPDLVETAQIVDLHPGSGYVGAVTVLSARRVRVRELDGAQAFAARRKRTGRGGRSTIEATASVPRRRGETVESMAHIDLGVDETRFPGIVGLMAFRPETARPLNQLANVLLFEPNSLSRGDRELIAAYVSGLNECTFCCESHSAFAAAQLPDGSDLVTKVRSDPESAPVSEQMKALLAIAGAVQQGGRRVTTGLIDRARAAGATDVEIHDTVLIAAAFCMFNRYVDGLGTVAGRDSGAYAAAAQGVVAAGYGMASAE
ncbi:peroxidase-related enzyme [Micromonospora siamensis]|uniref:Uncharacterized peroxidase-related enzyme n=2 Tax=Micromonospora siamensis TaxID=299152 RepID=A0A1C5J712_9ACTN|nr:peroxidase-related enzyme [Micromonospora siamensis]SCG66352.1 uncharacterized peroxidase-related enzyme [Micromonospora siamensis]